MDNSDYFAAVVDLETTGLDAQDNIPLELGIKIIDKEGFIFNEASWLIWEPSPEWSIEMGRGAAHPIVGPMHQASGLWDDLLEQRGKTTLTRRALDLEVCEWLTENNVRFGTLPMMGNSIGSLDRPFALQHFPKFNTALSYRNVDISTVKELCKANNPTLFKNLESIIGTKEDAKHRVLEDIDACIVEYQAYRDNFFFLEDD
jgi:oligoribonuclease